MKSTISPFVIDISCTEAGPGVEVGVDVGIGSLVVVIVLIGEDVLVCAGDIIGELAVGVHAANPISTTKMTIELRMS
jgi:hypothetical protein